MSRLSASTFAAMLAVFWFVVLVGGYRLLDWLFAGQTWLWAAFFVLPAMAFTITFVIDTLTEHPTDGAE